MSMDTLYEEIQEFLLILGSFNAEMSKNWDELQRTWASANELWFDDSTARTFRDNWAHMGDALKRYREDQGERYLQFLMRRKQALDEYFGG